MEKRTQERRGPSGGSTEVPPSACARTYTVPGRTVVELSDEIDIVVAESVTSHLDAATAGDRPQVVVDLRRVTFIDCSSLGLLCRARRRTLERGGTLALICVDPRVLRMMRLVGLLSAFVILSTVPEHVQDSP